MKAPTKIKSLLDKYNQLISEHQRHQQMGVDLEIQEKELMKTVNIDNKAEFDQIASIRLRREIVPHKVEEYATAADNVLDELGRECIIFESDFRKAITEKTSELASAIAKPLAPFFAPPTSQSDDEKLVTKFTNGSVFDAQQAADEICLKSVKGSVLLKIQDTLANSNFRDRRADDKAERLIVMHKEFSAL